MYWHDGQNLGVEEVSRIFPVAVGAPRLRQSWSLRSGKLLETMPHTITYIALENHDGYSYLRHLTPGNIEGV